MNIKRILFIAVCVLLATILVLTGIALSKVSGVLVFLNPPTPAPTEPTAPSETPTEPEATVHVHDYVLTDKIGAACDGYGWNIYTCQTCQHTHMPVDERIDPLGHNYEVSKSTEATCTEAGYTELTCTRCGRKDVPADQQQAPLGHSWGHGQVYVATCEEGGFTRFTCQRCCIEETKDQTEPLGHQFDDVINYPATCTEDAYTIALCVREGCGAQDQVTEAGTATGHISSGWQIQESGEFLQLCTACFTPLTEKAEEGKPYGILLDLQQTHADPSGEGVAYISHSVTIGISGDVSAKLFTYTVNDYLCNNTLTLSYEPGTGFVMEYTDQDGVNQRYFINHTAVLTITIPLTGAPTIE